MSVFAYPCVLLGSLILFQNMMQTDHEKIGLCAWPFKILSMRIKDLLQLTVA